VVQPASRSAAEQASRPADKLRIGQCQFGVIVGKLSALNRTIEHPFCADSIDGSQLSFRFCSLS
jgi:hypothetical protein